MSARLYVGECALDLGATLVLPQEAAHHALRVLRLRVGDAVILFDGRGGEWHAVVASAGRRGEEASVAIERFDPVERESPLAVTLAMSTLATDAMDYAVRKAVELGVAAIVPVVAARSQGGAARERRVDHWRRIAIAACEQCGRNRVPPIDAPRPLAAWLTARDSRRTGIMFSPEGDATLADVDVGSSVEILIGPEGGFDAAELAAATLAGLRIVAFGPRVLKAETACV
ncbi:MAG TPA: 16S rRNA (uracil(1498)-N(3))-methyltransferase, partial [Casimicrobiaceae bacterium]